MVQGIEEMEFKREDWERYFPYPEIREQQVEAIEFALRELGSGKRAVIIEAGTGVGKSAIGYTVSRAWCAKNPRLAAFEDEAGVEPGAWFVTTQKILQDQYIRDFSIRGMCSIKSSSNYQCSFKRGNTCADSQKELRAEEKGSRFWNACTLGCVYKKEKEKFLKASTSVTNFPYLLTEANYSGKITKRQLLVVDEAHNTEGELSKFIEVSVSERFCKSILKIPYSPGKTQHQAFLWIRDEYLPKVRRHLRHVEEMLEKHSGLKQKLADFVALARQIDLLKGHKEKLNKFVGVYSANNWVYEMEGAEGRKGGRVTFKPIDVSPFSEDNLFRLGERIVLMSATILDRNALCQSLGIRPEEAAFISLPSPFPVENRPIMFFPIGSMAQRDIDKTLPLMVDAVKSILQEHRKEKGVIHCNSYKIVNYLKRNIRSKRLLTHDSDNRDEVLKKHMRSKQPTVLLSPSMAEGVDLKDDASRFQIICKVPYPYLGDKLVSKRMNKWDWWYPLQTAKTIVQSVGRSVRSESDHAVTYILDSKWKQFYGRNRQMFPEDFRKCLK